MSAQHEIVVGEEISFDFSDEFPRRRDVTDWRGDTIGASIAELVLREGVVASDLNPAFRYPTLSFTPSRDASLGSFDTMWSAEWGFTTWYDNGLQDDPYCSRGGGYGYPSWVEQSYLYGAPSVEGGSCDRILEGEPWEVELSFRVVANHAPRITSASATDVAYPGTSTIEVRYEDELPEEHAPYLVSLTGPSGASDPGWSLVDSGSGLRRWKARFGDASQIGRWRAEFRIVDGLGQDDTETVTFEVTNEAPNVELAHTADGEIDVYYCSSGSVVLRILDEQPELCRVDVTFLSTPGYVPDYHTGARSDDDLVGLYFDLGSVEHVGTYRARVEVTDTLGLQGELEFDLHVLDPFADERVTTLIAEPEVAELTESVLLHSEEGAGCVEWRWRSSMVEIRDTDAVWNGYSGTYVHATAEDLISHFQDYVAPDHPDGRIPGRDLVVARREGRIVADETRHFRSEIAFGVRNQAPVWEVAESSAIVYAGDVTSLASAVSGEDPDGGEVARQCRLAQAPADVPSDYPRDWEYCPSFNARAGDAGWWVFDVTVRDNEGEPARELGAWRVQVDGVPVAGFSAPGRVYRGDGDLVLRGDDPDEGSYDPDNGVDYELFNDRTEVYDPDAGDPLGIAEWRWRLHRYTGPAESVVHEGSINAAFGVRDDEAELRIPTNAVWTGTYVFELVVTDHEGNESDPVRHQVEVHRANDEPIAVVGPPQYVPIMPVSMQALVKSVLDGSWSYDPDSAGLLGTGRDRGIASYHWDVESAPEMCAIDGLMEAEDSSRYVWIDAEESIGSEEAAGQCLGIWDWKLTVTDDDDDPDGPRSDSATQRVILGTCTDAVCIDYPQTEAPYFVWAVGDVDIPIVYHVDPGVWDNEVGDAICGAGGCTVHLTIKDAASGDLVYWRDDPSPIRGGNAITRSLHWYGQSYASELGRVEPGVYNVHLDVVDDGGAWVAQASEPGSIRVADLGVTGPDERRYVHRQGLVSSVQFGSAVMPTQGAVYRWRIDGASGFEHVVEGGRLSLIFPFDWDWHVGGDMLPAGDYTVALEVSASEVSDTWVVAYEGRWRLFDFHVRTDTTLYESDALWLGVDTARFWYETSLAPAEYDGDIVFSINGAEGSVTTLPDGAWHGEAGRRATEDVVPLRPGHYQVACRVHLNEPDQDLALNAPIDLVRLDTRIVAPLVEQDLGVFLHQPDGPLAEHELGVRVDSGSIAGLRVRVETGPGLVAWDTASRVPVEPELVTSGERISVWIESTEPGFRGGAARLDMLEPSWVDVIVEGENGDVRRRIPYTPVPLDCSDEDPCTRGELLRGDGRLTCGQARVLGCDDGCPQGCGTCETCVSGVCETAAESMCEPGDWDFLFGPVPCSGSTVGCYVQMAVDASCTSGTCSVRGDCRAAPVGWGGENLMRDTIVALRTIYAAASNCHATNLLRDFHNRARSGGNNRVLCEIRGLQLDCGAFEYITAYDLQAVVTGSELCVDSEFGRAGTIRHEFQHSVEQLIYLLDSDFERHNSNPDCTRDTVYACDRECGISREEGAACSEPDPSYAMCELWSP